MSTPDTHESTTPVHDYFGLTYSNFMVLHRSIMQAMPIEWQQKIVALLEEADFAVSADSKLSAMVEDNYKLTIRKPNGQFGPVNMKLMDYRYPCVEVAAFAERMRAS